MSIPKTKHMVTGREVLDTDREPIPVAGGGDEFVYLRIKCSSIRRVDVEV